MNHLKWYKPHPYRKQRKCEVCNKVFQAKTANAKYCSEKCRLEKWGYIKRSSLGMRKCETCGKSFKPKYSHHIFCSTLCATRLRQKGLNLCSYKGKEYFCEKFYFTCQECKQQFSPKELHVHHKIPLYQGGENIEENIIILCRKCHKKIHSVF